MPVKLLQFGNGREHCHFSVCAVDDALFAAICRLNPENRIRQKASEKAVDNCKNRQNRPLLPAEQTKKRSKIGKTDKTARFCRRSKRKRGRNLQKTAFRFCPCKKINKTLKKNKISIDNTKDRCYDTGIGRLYTTKNRLSQSRYFRRRRPAGTNPNDAR